MAAEDEELVVGGAGDGEEVAGAVEGEEVLADDVDDAEEARRMYW